MKARIASRALQSFLGAVLLCDTTGCSLSAKREQPQQPTAHRSNQAGLLSLGWSWSTESDLGGDARAGRIALSHEAKPRFAVAGTLKLSDGAHMVVAVYDQAGHLDTSFGTDGKAVLPRMGSDDTGYGIAYDAQNRIVVTGFASVGNANHFALARLGADGQPDPSFGEKNGEVTFSRGYADNQLTSVVPIPGGLLVGGMSTGPDGAYSMTVAKLSDNGTLDTTFGKDGYALSQGIGLNMDVVGSEIVIGGYNPTDAGPEGWVTRLDGSGNVLGTQAIEGSTAVFALRRVTDQTYAVGGWTHTSKGFDANAGIFNLDGTPVASFNHGSLLTFKFGELGDSAVADIQAAADGSLYLAGNANISVASRFAAAHLTTAGDLDALVTSAAQPLSIGRGDNQARSLIIAPDGGLVLAGFVKDGVDNFALAKLATP